MSTTVLVSEEPTQVRKCRHCRRVFVAKKWGNDFQTRCQDCKDAHVDAPAVESSQEEEYEAWRRDGEWKAVGEGCYRRRRSSG